MAMVTCPNCGHPNADVAKFCAKCGQKLTPAETLVMGAIDDSAPLPPARPPVISAKEQAAFNAPPATGPGAMPPPRPAPAPPPAYTPPSYTPPAYTPPPAVVPPLASGPAAAPASAGGHRFVAMRTIAGLANILAIVSAVLGFLGGLVWGYILGANMLGTAIGVLGGLIIGAIAGGLGWVYWRLLGEGIWVILDIETNTRRAAVALEERRP